MDIDLENDHEINADALMAMNRKSDLETTENLSLTSECTNKLITSDFEAATENRTENNDSPNTFNPVKLCMPAITCCGTRNINKFFRGCKWSPDVIGNRILSCDGNSTLRVYHSFLNKIDHDSSQISNECLEIRNIGTIFDYDWYPIISPSNYYVMVASSLGPLHIYDLVIGKCISSYQMFNLKDEAVYANCVACFPDGSRILGATKDYIFLFDVNQPGRTYERITSRRFFKKGILSSLAVNPLRYGMFAVGSYNNNIGIYDENTLLCMLHGHRKGITHLKFSPNGLFLYSGTRGSGEMICWDLRNPGRALYKLQRCVKTQQRIYFDITSDSRYVFSGNTDGKIFIWDTIMPPCENLLVPAFEFQAHQDCTNGVSVHPKLPFLATTSGQYHNHNWVLHYDSDDENEYVALNREENSLKLWHVDFKW